MIRETLYEITRGQDLSPGDMKTVIEEILAGAATPAQIGAFLVALNMKGTTADEITAAAKVLRARAIKIDARASTIVDTAGTGGDGLHTFNISTTVALVIAAAGISVAKHGNRSVSSRSGSADVLAALGVNIMAPPEIMEECLQEHGIAFLFAPLYHGAMKQVQAPRQEIGLRTIFNLLGPLLNPASATAQVLGVWAAKQTEMMACVLGNLGGERAFVVHGQDGLDEASVSGPTRVSELEAGVVTTYDLYPEEFFGDIYPLEALTGGDPEQNAAITRAILAGEDSPRRKIVLLNAALGIIAAGMATDIREGIEIAAAAIDSGGAAQKLDTLITVSNGG